MGQSNLPQLVIWLYRWRFQSSLRD